MWRSCPLAWMALLWISSSFCQLLWEMCNGTKTAWKGDSSPGTWHFYIFLCYVELLSTNDYTFIIVVQLQVTPMISSYMKKKNQISSSKNWIDETQFMTVVWLPWSSSSLIRITAWGAPQPLCFYGNQILSSQNPKCCWKILNILAIPCVKQIFSLYLRWKTELHVFFLFFCIAACLYICWWKDFPEPIYCGERWS